MAPSDLSPAAPAYVPQASIFHLPAAPKLECYQPHPVAPGLPVSFPGPPPPPPLFSPPFHPPLQAPVFARSFQGPPPPPVFSGPFQVPPPPHVFSVPPFMGFQPPVLGIAPPPPPRMPMALEAPPVPAREATLPRLAADPKDGGDKAPSASAGTWRVASGRRPRPKPLLPPRQRASDGGHGGAKEEPANQPSPRSVLAGAGTSPPDSPPVVLPPAFPHSPPSSPPPASTRRAGATEPRWRRVHPAGSKHVAPRSPQKASSGQGARGRDRKPRRLFNPACSMTTLMVRNIPNGFSRKKLMNILDQHCAVENEQIASAGGGGGVLSEYDFLYVPFDFKTNANKGYAFVNVTSPEAARRLWEYLHGYKWKTKDSHKTCEVDYAIVQGLEALVSHFSGSCFECHTAEFLPVCFAPPRDGARPADERQRVHVVGRLMPRLS